MYMHQWNMGPGFAGHDMWGGGWLLGLVAVLGPFIALLVLWSIAWKGLALWHAARRGQYWWFFILLVVNTFGILEIIYLFFLIKLKWSDLLSTRSGHAH